MIDRVSVELDTARSAARGLRGEARQAVLERLMVLDAELLTLARQALSESDREAITGQADAELSTFRGRMTAEAFARARDAAIDRLARDRFSIPTLTVL